MKKLVLLTIKLLCFFDLIAQVAYIPNPDIATYNRLAKKNTTTLASPGEFILRVINNDTTVFWNYPFNFLGAGYKETTICNDSINYYDSRLLGTWISCEGKFITVINKNGSSFFYRNFAYQDNIKKFVLQCKYSELRVTNIDNNYFMERDFGIDCEGRTYPDVGYFAVKYELLNDSDMVLSPISLRYGFINPDTTVVGFYKNRISFNSTEEYRTFVRKNISNQDFFIEGYHFHRFTGYFAKVGDESQVSDSRGILGVAALLLLGVLLLPSGSDPTLQQTQLIDQRHILGYDQYWNPIYDAGVHTGGELYYDSNGHPKQ